ncbi:MAG: hypothetical protein AB8G22_12825 [Saprospiraceae bacterium]
MSTAPKKKRLMRPYEKFLAIVSVLILVYFVLESMGIHIVQHEGTNTEVVNPGANYHGSKEVYHDAEIDAKVNAKLEEMAREFSAETQGRARVHKQDLLGKGLSEDEAEYYENVKERSKFSEQVESAKDWYNVLRASQKTYSKVRNVFAGTDSGEEEITTDDISTMLNNETLRTVVFEKIQDQFSIPKSEAAEFANQGKRELNEWADFVEKNRQN